MEPIVSKYGGETKLPFYLLQKEVLYRPDRAPGAQIFVLPSNILSYVRTT